MHKSWKKWTESEDRLLKSRYLTDATALKQLLKNHTWNAIKLRAERKFHLKANWTSNRLWTADEIQFLKQNYRRLPCEQIAKALNRSINAVHLKAQKLGIINAPPLVPIKLAEFDLGYLAGVIDGEGTLTLKKTGRGKRNYSPYLIISNTFHDMIARINQMLQNEATVSLKNNGENCKPIYELRIRRREVLLPLLEELQHCLIVKKQQCILLLEYLRLRMSRNPSKKGKKCYSEREHEIYRELKELNKRGKRT